MGIRPTKAQLDDVPEIDTSGAKVLRRGPKDVLGPRMSLRALREAVGKTQVDVATSTEMAQGDVSRLEQQREDVKVSTLRRYLRALGAELELVVRLESGHQVRIDWSATRHDQRMTRNQLRAAMDRLGFTCDEPENKSKVWKSGAPDLDKVSFFWAGPEDDAELHVTAGRELLRSRYASWSVEREGDAIWRGADLKRLLLALLCRT
jgi:transcriptional regulator with XRE-family HTH domain